MTIALLLIGPETFETRDIPPEIGADWCMWLAPQRRFCWGELHRCDGQNPKELEAERFPSYRDTDDPVLWAVQGRTRREEETRMEAMIARAAVMRRPYFVTYSALMDGDTVIYRKDGKPSCLLDV